MAQVRQATDHTLNVSRRLSFQLLEHASVRGFMRLDEQAVLIYRPVNDLRTSGGVGEWLKPPVLKTGNRKVRGFESRPLRQF
jgi:hypothetical protein